jgi:hypothetical protein
MLQQVLCVLHQAQHTLFTAAAAAAAGVQMHQMLCVLQRLARSAGGCCNAVQVASLCVKEWLKRKIACQHVMLITAAA